MRYTQRRGEHISNLLDYYDKLNKDNSFKTNVYK